MYAQFRYDAAVILLGLESDSEPMTGRIKPSYFGHLYALHQEVSPELVFGLHICDESKYGSGLGSGQAGCHFRYLPKTSSLPQEVRTNIWVGPRFPAEVDLIGEMLHGLVRHVLHFYRYARQLRIDPTQRRTLIRRHEQHP